MQSNYSEFFNTLTSVNAKASTTHPQTTSTRVLMYRGIAYAMPKSVEPSTTGVAQGRSLPADTQLCYRGATYTIQNSGAMTSQAQRMTEQQLIYRGASYWVSPRF